MARRTPIGNWPPTRVTQAISKLTWTCTELMSDSPATIELSSALTIALKFGDDVDSIVRSRIDYAFRVFASIYKYRVLDGDLEEPRLRCIYARSAPRSLQPRVLHIPARYQSGVSGSKIKHVSKKRYAGEDLYLAFGIDAGSGLPDWLGEVFVWLSCGYEISDGKKDEVGRIAHSETIFGRFGANPRKPYASILLAWMEKTLREGDLTWSHARATAPLENAKHIVLPSHDIDYCYTTSVSASVRLLKNALLSVRPYRNAGFFVDSARQFGKLLQGTRVGNYLPALLQNMEALGVRSTFFAVARHGHRRDPNYQLAMIAESLRDANRRGFSIGVHGSYSSAFEARTLAKEVGDLSRELGQCPLGGRQHWLRFDGYEELFGEVARAGLRFESSLGFPEHAGFRNGAAFPFPPYNFRTEAPYDFLEVPLVLMDGALEAESRNSHENPQAIADEVLGESRRWGWGGISILWHNPIEPLQVPAPINSIFWKCAERRPAAREAWISADHFFQLCLDRFKNAGLLKTVPTHA